MNAYDEELLTEALAEGWFDDAPGVVRLADVQPERVSWLWPGRLPLGKLVVIDGDPSTGKSTLMLDLAARITTNTPFPDGTRPGDGPAGAGVLLLSAEDGLADTIAPRLIAAGADLEWVHALTEVPVRDQDGITKMVPPSLPRDIPVIRRIVEDESVSLVIVDVLMAYLNGKVDSHRDQDVRGVLH
ncbi:MAG: AAA family ATPase, partial [Actinomycetota bacterium]|nr:AAA family ATPase [Actinomycetota bacterium]